MSRIISATLIAAALIFASFQVSGTYNIVGKDRVFVATGAEIIPLWNRENKCTMEREEFQSPGYRSVEKEAIGTVLKTLRCYDELRREEGDVIIVDIGSSVFALSPAAIIPLQ